MVRAAYSLLAYCALLPLLAFLWWRGRKDPAYRLRWSERLASAGSAPEHLRGGVVLHCASVGEVIAARPLVELLLADARWGPLLLTCTTPTGSRLLRHTWGDRVTHRYFPLDLPGATHRFLCTWRPQLVVLLERELWPNFLHQAQTLGIPVALVNARLSEPSAVAYARWRGLIMPALASLRLVCAEDATTAQRLTALGVRPERLYITGNIKSDVQLDAALRQRIRTGRQALAARPVLTAGSTHAGEDEALVAAFMVHLVHFPQTLLVLVPRHPERFAPVARLLARAGLRFARLSLGQLPVAGTQVLLGDTLGELLYWYGAADACFVGGSLIPRGGHNPLEVLCHAKPLITGPHTANFEPLYTELQQGGALLRVSDAAAVFQQFRMLLQDPSTAKELATRGQAMYQHMAGASARTVALLEGLVAPLSKSRAPPPLVMRHGGDLIWADPRYFNSAQPQLFDPAWWQQPGRTSTPQGAGRGNIHWVADARHTYLLRHYYRGGVAAKLSRDLFLAQAISESRAMREFTLLAQLRAKGLPVPQACAARHSRHYGFWYRADILVERIPNATDVATVLHQQRAVTTEEWHALGRAVRQLHDAQVCHCDLNCHNLMLDIRGKAWIVDFDKCGFRAGDTWKQANLDRLLRSLRKELRLDPGFRWSEDQWQPLLDGYAVQQP